MEAGLAGGQGDVTEIVAMVPGQKFGTVQTLYRTMVEKTVRGQIKRTNFVNFENVRINAGVKPTKMAVLGRTSFGQRFLWFLWQSTRSPLLCIHLIGALSSQVRRGQTLTKIRL